MWFHRKGVLCSKVRRKLLFLWIVALGKILTEDNLAEKHIVLMN